jgi:cysteine desulfurase family protein
VTIYLDNAATSSPKPPEVAAAMVEHLALAANPGRAAHRRAVAAERMIDDARLKLARLLNAEDPRRIIFTLNCTDALNMAIHGVIEAAIERGAKRPHVVTTVLEHNSVSRPLVAMKNAGRIDMTQVGCDTEGFLDPQAIAAAIRDDTALVAFTAASNALGTLQPAREICQTVRGGSAAMILIDAAQSTGVVPTDVQTLGADFLAFPGHKALLGPTGTGALYVGPRAFPDESSPHAGIRHIRPFREGGTGGDSASPVMPEQLPFFLEGGTANTVGIAGLAAGVQWIMNRPAESVARHERSLIARFIDGSADLPHIRIIGTKAVDRRVGALSFTIEGWEPLDAAAVLDETFDIALRPGLHCAPYAHRAMGTFSGGGTVRISPGPFNTDQDIDRLLDALRRLADA